MMEVLKFINDLVTMCTVMYLQVEWVSQSAWIVEDAVKDLYRRIREGNEASTIRIVDVAEGGRKPPLRRIASPGDGGGDCFVAKDAPRNDINSALAPQRGCFAKAPRL